MKKESKSGVKNSVFVSVFINTEMKTCMATNTIADYLFIPESTTVVFLLIFTDLPYN